VPDPDVEPLFESPKLLAAVKLLERTGARNYRVGYSDPEDGDPVVWYAVATWRIGTDGRPIAKGGRERHEAGGGLGPVSATMRLCEQVIDGGLCTHCKQLTIFDDNPGDSPFDDLLDVMGCVYAWDPELSTFRRGCEGDHA
jgi:hypothetical protein